MRYTVRPLSDRTWLGTKGTEPTRFRVKWSSTIDLLETEIAFLRGHDVVLEVDVEEKDLRLDGTLRANASPASRAVAVAFESKHGPLLYRCDRFVTAYYHQGPEWQHNVRAIALTLQALRAVDRYGASASGEQYRGYKAIGAGPATEMPAGMSKRNAAEVLERVAIGGEGSARARVIDRIMTDPAHAKDVLRHARAACHPDRGGPREVWDQVELAGRTLGLVS